MTTRKRWDITVTGEDLAHGEPRDSNRCAVKRAVARDIEGAKRVEVDLQTVRFSLNDDRFVYLTPWQVAEYVIAFDAGDQVEPFSFQLRSPVEIGPKVRRAVFTEEGKQVDAARNRVRKAKARKEMAEEYLDNPESTSVEVAKAEEILAEIEDVIAERERDYEAVREEVKAAGKPRLKRVDSDKPKAPRRAKTRTRHFGQRVLRVNQAEGRMHVT